MWRNRFQWRPARNRETLFRMSEALIKQDCVLMLVDASCKWLLRLTANSRQLCLSTFRSTQAREASRIHLHQLAFSFDQLGPVKFTVCIHVSFVLVSKCNNLVSFSRSSTSKHCGKVDRHSGHSLIHSYFEIICQFLAINSIFVF